MFYPSPLVYVISPGSYKCKVSYAGEVIFSHMIKVYRGELRHMGSSNLISFVRMFADVEGTSTSQGIYSVLHIIQY